MKWRVCRRYNSSAGTWYVIQRKRLFFWKTLPICFVDIRQALQVMYELQMEIDVEELEIIETVESSELQTDVKVPMFHIDSF